MTIIYLIWFFLLGITLASSFQLIGERVPLKQTIMGRSMCDKCNHQLNAIDIIPIFGYIIRRGKCKYCHSRISIKYPIFELIGGLLFGISFWYYGLTTDLLIVLILISVMMVEVIADIRHRYVIDVVWALGLAALLVIRIIDGGIVTYLISSLSVFVGLWLIAFIAQKILKKEALGGGDVKIYLFIGFVLTVWNNILSLFLASLIALIYAIAFKKTKEYIPLIPFIAVSAIIVFYFGDQMINWYLGLFRM